MNHNCIRRSSEVLGSITARFGRLRRFGILFFAVASVFAGFFGTPDAALAAKLFAVTATDAGASSDAVYRFEVGPTGTPVLDLTLVDSSFHLTHSIAFSANGELFITNRTGGTSGSGSVSRFLNPGGAPATNGLITDSAFSGPVGAVFRGSELFIAQVSSNNVLRFVVDASGNAVFNGAITVGPPGAPISTRGVTVNPATGELFVTLCCGVHAINRYTFNASGNAVPHGVITGGGLNNPVDMAFSPWGELFVSNATAPTISRFTFDIAGNALPQLQITGNGLFAPHGVTFSPWGELFVSSYLQSRIFRWTFGSSSPHNAIANGSFIPPFPLADIEFLPETVPVTIQASPNELSFSVSGTGCDAGDYVTPRQLAWIPSPAWTPSPEGCTVNFAEGADPTRYVFTPSADWGANPRHFDVPVVATTYTASSKTQHEVTTSIIPMGGGTVSGNGYYDENTSVSVTAASSPGYVFENFSGDLTGAANPQDLTMNAPKNVIGNFAQISSLTVAPAAGQYSDAVQLSATFGPPGLAGTGSIQFSVAGTPVGAPVQVSGAGPYTTSYVITLGQGTHSISAVFTSSTPTVGSSNDVDTLTVTHEDATVTPSGGNPTVVNANAGGTAGPITMLASIQEQADGSLGDISNAVPVTATLVPQAGSSIDCVVTTNGGGTGGTLGVEATCSNVPPTVYAVHFDVGGIFYEGSNHSASLTVTAPITITSSPAGRSFSITGIGCQAGSYSGPQTLNWIPGASCQIAFSSPQAGPTGTQFVFATWADGVNTDNPRTFSAPAVPATFTANFTTQYLLTTEVNPAGTGTITEAGYYDASSSVAVSAAAAAEYTFTGFSGSLAGTNTPQNVLMDAPKSVTANFAVAAVTITITSSIPGRSFTVTGADCQSGPYATPQPLQWKPGSSCQIAFSSPQAGPTGTQYVFSTWADSGNTANPRTFIVPAAPAAFTANFTTQYLLTTTVNPAGGGSITGGGTYHNAGGTPTISATPNPGFTFVDWSGPVASSTSASTTVLMNGPQTVTANFATSGGISLSGSTSWIGLKNSDDQGTQFDLRTELYKNGNLISSGQTLCITGVTRNENQAKQVAVLFGSVSGGSLNPGDMLSVKMLTRIGTNPDGSKCSGPGGSHSNAVGLRLYYDSTNRPSRFGAAIAPNPLSDFFLHSTGTDYFDPTAPTASLAKFKDSPGVNFAGGNPWKAIGTWNRTMP